jgi:hypothetical protein
MESAITHSLQLLSGQRDQAIIGYFAHVLESLSILRQVSADLCRGVQITEPELEKVISKIAHAS